MPEGDSVWRAARKLDQALSARELLDADLRWPSLATAKLAGMTVIETVPRGKHILTRLDSGWTLHSHLRMDGSWVIRPTTREGSLRGGSATLGQARRPSARARAAAIPLRMSGRRPESRGGGFVRAALVGPDYTAIGVDLGMLDLVRTREEHTLVGHLGPDLLDPAFDAELAVANLAKAEGTIGAALLDQTNLAGIGTIWASETLFAERLWPWLPAAGLSTTTLTRLVARAQRFLLASIRQSVPSSTGSVRHGENSYVHGRAGRPCRRCGRPIQVAPIGPPTRERPMFHCPTCQPQHT
ncbi:MAG: DNA-formamidopyrimidine glycosylase family protein [Propionicimonas sp.]